LFSKIRVDSTKVRLELDSISKKQVEFLSAGSLKYMDLFSKDYTDLGGGSIWRWKD